MRTDRVREHFLGAPDEGEEEQKLDDVVELPSHVKAGPYQKVRGGARTVFVYFARLWASSPESWSLYMCSKRMTQLTQPLAA